MHIEMLIVDEETFANGRVSIVQSMHVKPMVEQQRKRDQKISLCLQSIQKQRNFAQGSWQISLTWIFADGDKYKQVDLLQLVREDIAVTVGNDLLSVREDGGSIPVLLLLQQLCQLILFNHF